MKQLIHWFLTLAFGLCMATSAMAKEGSTKEEAVAMVKQAIAYYKANGREKTAAAIMAKNPMFIKGTLFVTACDINGISVANPTAPKMVGNNMIDLRDADGKLFVREIVDVAKTRKSGWVEFRWRNPVTRELDTNTLYVELADDQLFFTAGVYK